MKRVPKVPPVFRPGNTSGILSRRGRGRGGGGGGEVFWCPRIAMNSLLTIICTRYPKRTKSF